MFVWCGLLCECWVFLWVWLFVCLCFGYFLMVLRGCALVGCWLLLVCGRLLVLVFV